MTSETAAQSASHAEHFPPGPLPSARHKDFIERARDVAPVIAAAAPRIEAERQLPAEVLDAMHDAALFRLSMPRAIGGAELDPAGLAQVTEIIAGADASAAWCLGQALGCAMSAAFMEPEAAVTVFGPANAVLAWGAGVAGTATVTEGGYRVNGTWRFASGGKHATWLGAHCKVLDANGEPRRDANGKSVNRTMLLPREDAQIHDDWHVMGLKGTRSEGYTVDDLFVESSFSLDRETPCERRVAAPLFVFPTTNVYAGAFSGVALGIARAALDDLVELARHKRARGAATALRDSPVFQNQLAVLEGTLRAARAYQQDTLRRAFDEVSQTMDITLEHRVAIRLATTFAIRQSTHIVAEVYRLAGSDAIFEQGPFERRFRDMHAVSQQVQGRESNFETVGQHLLGHEVSHTFL